MTKEKFGTDTALYNKLFYNSRGQLSEIREGTSYTGPTDTTWDRGAIINHYSNQAGCWGASCNATDNNGNLRRQEVYIPRPNSTDWDNFAQFYDYDSLNRLQSVRENLNGGAVQWQQKYTYDRYGNRTINTATNQTWGNGINNRDFAVETATNRLYAPGDLSLAEASRQMQYDQAGNLKKDVYSGAGVTRTYDAENRMTSETQASNYVAGVYTYNADGQRVRRKIDNVETWQVYGMDGEVLVEYAANAGPVSPQKEYGYRNGQLLIAAEAAAVSTSGLVGYWKFDENSGTTAVDSSGNGNTGTLQSGASWATGHSNSAINFDGVDDYVKIKDGKISSSTTGTISVWVKLNALVNATKIVGYGGAGAASVQATFGLEMRQDGSNYYFSIISVPYDGCVCADSAHGSTVLQTGVWYHLALTSNGSSWQLYVNGVAETMTNQLTNGNTGKWFGNTTAASPDKTYIGGTRFNGADVAFFNGVIDEVRIYDRALNANEVSSLANGGGTSANINWLVTDQLGTPRMIFDKTGTLAAVKRHDYLPFGEELFAGTGGRTTAQGYSSNDGLRNHFTGQERDTESGLDYFGARYFSAGQGRFTSVDPLLASASVGNPQSFNRYTYALNAPTNFTDPSGMLSMDMTSAMGQFAHNWGSIPDVADPGGVFTAGGIEHTPEIPYQGYVRTWNSIVSFLQQAFPPQNGGPAGPAANAVPQSARGGPNNTVIVAYSDGGEEVRSGGSRSWRNNNPGNIRTGGQLQGEIGAAARFAVFSSEAAGQAGIVELLGRPGYQAQTVAGAIARWAPPNENNTAGYQQWVQNVTGINGQTRMNTLSGAQLQSMANAIRGIEGWRPGTVTFQRPQAAPQRPGRRGRH